MWSWEEVGDILASLKIYYAIGNLHFTNNYSTTTLLPEYYLATTAITSRVGENQLRGSTKSQRNSIFAIERRVFGQNSDGAMRRVEQLQATSDEVVEVRLLESNYAHWTRRAILVIFDTWPVLDHVGQEWDTRSRLRAAAKWCERR